MVDINTVRNIFGPGVISLEKEVVKGNKQPVMFDDLNMATSSLNGQFTRHILNYKHILLIENHIWNPMSYSWTVSSKFIFTQANEYASKLISKFPLVCHKSGK